ncbi:pyruvate, phosphate dikinase [Oricola cellulosilytica]|uniref:Pyruvate, phosphate dikinase n=1 Tax=Oricola cellulosilytica TaxID=1429082 RepID=A0A4R0P3S0_9HYPH|nr:pyruvate, phosphate dikinase [Oricola cellulosilytica]TCD11289.1 pyruvate, phosphate dikinase [Oricola cellulosilytica]
MANWVYSFGAGKADGSARDRARLGGKGASLAEMARLGLPVPPGFTIATDLCQHYYSNGKSMPDGIQRQVETALQALERVTRRTFGAGDHPLLVSVRSGSRDSMPGMLDTVLNLGLNDDTVEALARSTGNTTFAHDSYRRFIQMYASVVMGLEQSMFEDVIHCVKRKMGMTRDADLGARDWQAIIARYKGLVRDELGEEFPQDPFAQLWGAITAVLQSWMSPRAITYRALHAIPADWGTAVTVQSMVFGNMGEGSATGVAFTRDPATGDDRLYGEFLPNAQGEDVVGGARTPHPLTKAQSTDSGRAAMDIALPVTFQELKDVARRLENHYRDVQDIEFTVETGKLWLLQTRTGKRTPRAAVRIAVDMAEKGLISKPEALRRIDPASLEQLLHPMISPDVERTVIGRGLPASPGAASGAIVFTSEEAEEARAVGRRTILVRPETSPEDIHGMHAAEGILTIHGGTTSHAAVVARGMGKPCISGANSVRMNVSKGILITGGRTLKSGDVITLDGTRGEVLLGELPTVQPELSGDFGTLMEWADEIRRMKVRTNAETPDEARVAREFGAEGIGLCRTERMFYDDDRIRAMRAFILASDDDARARAIDTLQDMQKADFLELFEIMSGQPVTIRLFDPPLHEFLPRFGREMEDTALAMGVEVEQIRQKAEELHEVNPMLGNRGVRLAICYPEIIEMQARAIFQAVLEAGKKTGETVVPEIMVPLVAYERELKYIKDRIDVIAKAAIEEWGREFKYLVGTMIELPRAAIRADRIAEGSEFFSFGTNDLTQSTFGISRDDAGVYLNEYLQKGIIDRDPFLTIDVEGVGEFIRMACERGQRTRPDITLGICGEHGGDPASIQFCEAVGLHYVSCSPYRVPVARLAAAQATLANGGG